MIYYHCNWSLEKTLLWIDAGESAIIKGMRCCWDALVKERHSHLHKAYGAATLGNHTAHFIRENKPHLLRYLYQLCFLRFQPWLCIRNPSLNKRNLNGECLCLTLPSGNPLGIFKIPIYLWEFFGLWVNVGGICVFFFNHQMYLTIEQC